MRSGGGADRGLRAAVPAPDVCRGRGAADAMAPHEPIAACPCSSEGRGACSAARWLYPSVSPPLPAGGRCMARWVGEAPAEDADREREGGGGVSRDRRAPSSVGRHCSTPSSRTPADTHHQRYSSVTRKRRLPRGCGGVVQHQIQTPLTTPLRPPTAAPGGVLLSPLLTVALTPTMICVTQTCTCIA